LILENIPKPPNCKSFFIGDETGGSGWVVQNEDGEEEKFYITFNKSIVDLRINLAGLPTELPYEDTSILNLCAIYYEYLSNLVGEAKQRFS